MNATRKTIGLHLLSWTLYISYTQLGYFLYDWKFEVLLLSLSQNLLHIVQFYACYLVVFPLWMRYRKWLVLAAGIAGAMTLYIMLRYLIEEKLY